VSRYYVAEGATRDVYEQAAKMLGGAGFTLESTGLDPCDRLEGMSLCSVQGVANDRRMWVQVWPPGAEFTGIQIEDATGPIVSVTVEGGEGFVSRLRVFAAFLAASLVRR